MGSGFRFHTRRMHRQQAHRWVGRAIVAAVLVSASLVASAQTPEKGFQIFQGLRTLFTVQYPSKDWQVVPGGSASLVAFTQKKAEATVVIEYQTLQLELAPTEIDDGFAQIEAEPIAQHQPTATDVQGRIADADGRKVVVIDYNRKGVGGPEKVRQYSMPIGKQMYRIVCSAPAPLFAKYEPTFVTIVRTFAVAGAAPAGPAKSE